MKRVSCGQSVYVLWRPNSTRLLPSRRLPKDASRDRWRNSSWYCSKFAARKFFANREYVSTDPSHRGCQAACCARSARCTMGLDLRSSGTIAASSGLAVSKKRAKAPKAGHVAEAETEGTTSQPPSCAKPPVLRKAAVHPVLRRSECVG